MAIRFKNILPDLMETLVRFPVPVAASLWLWLYHFTTGDSGLFGAQINVFWSATAAFLAGGSGHLLAEGRGWSRAVNLLIAGFAGAAGAGLAYFYASTSVSYLFLLSGLALLLMVAGFMHRGAPQGALWLFNMRLCLATLLALVVGVVFGAGLSAVIAGLKFLLDIDLGYRAFDHVWTTAVVLVGPVFGLAMVPRDLTEQIDITSHKGSLLERGLSVLVNYVMVPLVLVYVLILHAYAAKIIESGSLPKGEVGTMVSLFAIGGTATWLMAWPWREQGTWLLRFFMRSWFWFLPVPAVLLAIAIWRRVSDYGVTPDRYGVALVAVWTLLVFATLLVRRNRADMRVIIGGAAVLLLASSFGPQGAFAVTARSQFARLVALLDEGHALKDGHFAGKVQGLSQQKINDAYSIMQALFDVRGLQRVASLFGPDQLKAQPSDPWAFREELNAKLGIAYDYVSNGEGRFSFDPAKLADVTVDAGSRLIGPFNTYSGANNTTLPHDVILRLDGQGLYVLGGGVSKSLPVADLVKQLRAAMPAQGQPDTPLRIDLKDGVALVILSANGKETPEPAVDNITGWLVLPKSQATP